MFYEVTLRVGNPPPRKIYNRDTKRYTKIPRDTLFWVFLIEAANREEAFHMAEKQATQKIKKPRSIYSKCTLAKNSIIARPDW